MSCGTWERSASSGTWERSASSGTCISLMREISITWGKYGGLVGDFG